MADTLIQERYQFDFDPGGSIAELGRLAKSLETIRSSIDAAKASGKSYERQQAELTATEQKFLAILNQEVSTYDGINAKRKILVATLDNLKKGTAQYNTVLKQVRVLQERELSTTTGLNNRRKELKATLDTLEKGTKDYTATLRQLEAVEKRAASSAAGAAKSSGGFATALKGGLASIGVVVGIQEALRLGRESIDAASEKQQQKNALLAALGNQEAVQQRLIAQADKLEATTLVDDDDIIKLDRYLASLGFTEKQIKSLNEASVQLAAVTGKSVRGATDLLIAAQSGQIRGISKLIPEVKNLSKAQLAAGAATDLVAKKFAGSAEALKTGFIGAKKELKDFTDNAKEGLGDALINGLGALTSSVKNTFQGIFGGISSQALDFIGEFGKELLKVPADIIAVVNGSIQVVFALFQSAVAGVQRLGNDIQVAYLDIKEAIFGGLDTEDLLKSSKLAGERVKINLTDPFKNSNIGEIFTAGFNDALKDADQFSKAFSGTVKDVDNTPFLPKTKAEVKVVAGSLADLEKQVNDLRESITKSVVTTDVKTLEPLLLKIQLLENRIKEAKKLQESLVPKKIEDVSDISTRNLQADFLKNEIEKAKIEEQFIRQNSAERLKAIEDEQRRQVTAVGVTASQRANIEADFQRRREALAIDTDRRIATNALQQKSLELQQLQSTSKPGQNLEGIAKLKAEIADLQAKLAAIENKTVDLEVKVTPDSKEKLKADIKEIEEAVIGLAQNVITAISSVFDAQKSRADKAVDYQKTKLSEALANSKDFTAEQIKLERDRLDKLQKQQEQAAQRAKAAQILQVVANTVIAVSKAAAQGGALAPLTIITTLAAIAAGIGSAVALSQNAFYEGTDFVQRGKNPKGKDTVPAMLHEGEAVVQADVNKAYHPTIRAMRRWDISPEQLNEFVQSARGGSQFVSSGQRAALPTYAHGAAQASIASGGNQNYYFQAKLGRLEQESERQTQVLETIAANTRPRRNITRLSGQNNRPHRFV